MREIPLTRGKVALVDDDDFPTLSAYRWNARPAQQARDNWYAARSAMIDGRNTTVYMHRFIMKAACGEEIDHENRNGLDNRKINLRTCTRSLNNANAKWGDAESGFRGVYRNHRRWRARIQVGGVAYRLGNFSDKIAAARAYDAAAIAMFGKFATLNFPPADEQSAHVTISADPQQPEAA